MKDKQKSKKLLEAFAEGVSVIDDHAEVISGQIKGAAKEYPQLVAAFEFFTAYVGHIHHIQAVRAGLADIEGILGLTEYKPWPPGPSLPPIPEKLCKALPDWCACQKGDVKACERAEKTVEKVIDFYSTFSQVRTCSEILDEYEKVLDEIFEYSNNPFNPGRYSRYLYECKMRAMELYYELLERNCIDIESLKELTRSHLKNS